MRRLTLWGCLSSSIGCAAPAPEVAMRTPPAATAAPIPIQVLTPEGPGPLYPACGQRYGDWRPGSAGLPVDIVVRYFARHVK